MARTRVPSEQLTLRSERTGTHLLDKYLEDAEHGNKTLAQLLGMIFNEVTGDIDAFDFRYVNDTDADTQTLELRIGTDGEYQEVASFTEFFQQLEDYADLTLDDMEAKRSDAEDSAAEAARAEEAALQAKADANEALSDANAARDAAQTYAAQAYATTPTVIQESILISQLHGELFNGSTF